MLKRPEAVLILCSCILATLWTISAHCELDVPVECFRMDEAWRVGADDERFFLGEVEDLMIDKDGTIFVLDSQQSKVIVLAPTGEFLRSIGRDGDGPGEVRSPGNLALMPDGSLGLVSKLNWKIAKIDKETGQSRGDIRVLGPGGELTMVEQILGTYDSGNSNGFAALIRESTGQFWHWKMFLGLYLDYGDGQQIYPLRVLREVGEAEGSDREEEEYFTVWDPWTVDTWGRIVVAPYWDSYTLQYFDTGGELVNQVELPYSQRPRTAKEKARLLEKVWGGTSPKEFGVELVLSKTEAVVRRIHARQDGRIWIQTSNSAHGVEAGVFRIYDVVGPDGNLEARAEIRGEADDLVDHVYFGPEDLMVVVHGAERFVQNHRGLKSNATEYELAIAGYHLRKVGDD